MTYPEYLIEIFVFRNSSDPLRGQNIQTLPIPRATNYRLESLQHQAAKIWNTLPDISRITTLCKDVETVINKMNF